MIFWIVFGLWFVSISFITFCLWLEPAGLKNLWQYNYKQPWIASLFTVIFVMNCFILGVMISIYRLEGNI